jgi:hypothetical protein
MWYNYMLNFQAPQNMSPNAPRDGEQGLIAEGGVSRLGPIPRHLNKSLAHGCLCWLGRHEWTWMTIEQGHFSSCTMQEAIRGYFYLCHGDHWSKGNRGFYHILRRCPSLRRGYHFRFLRDRPHLLRPSSASFHFPFRPLESTGIGSPTVRSAPGHPWCTYF